MTKPVIIAEAGVNHNGSLERALSMAEAAKAAGADYVKFQTFKSESLVTTASRTAAYQKQNCNADSQLEMLRCLELDFNAFIKIKEHCDNLGIGFLSTPFDFESIAFLASLGMDFIKIPSGEITDLPYLRMIAATRIPAIVSTGMSTLDEIGMAVSVFAEKGYTASDLTLLHCNTQYPTPYEDVNLNAMATLRDTFGLPAGYSDHTSGIAIPVAATALGATVIEKHFTLSRSLPGPDHVASLEPDELSAMVRAIRQTAAAMGSGIKIPSPSESANMAVARRSIVASRDIAKGEILSAANLTVKRPGTGLSPMLWDEVIGKRAVRDFTADQQIEL